MSSSFPVFVAPTRVGGCAASAVSPKPVLAPAASQNGRATSRFQSAAGVARRRGDALRPSRFVSVQNRVAVGGAGRGWFRAVGSWLLQARGLESRARRSTSDARRPPRRGGWASPVRATSAPRPAVDLAVNSADGSSRGAAIGRGTDPARWRARPSHLAGLGGPHASLVSLQRSHRKHRSRPPSSSHAVRAKALGSAQRQPARRWLPAGNSSSPLHRRFRCALPAPVVEIDGEYDARIAAKDARRDCALSRAGWRVLRIDAALVMADIEAAVALVRSAPSPQLESATGP